MEPQDINYLINKYSRTPSHRSDHFQTSEFSPRSSFSPFRDPNSKAYAAAMRALHERIRFLECENTELFQNLKSSESRLQETLRQNDKLTQEIGVLVSNERKDAQTINELKKEATQAQREVKILQGQLMKMENSDLQGLSNENLKLKVELDNAIREVSEAKEREMGQRMKLEKLEEKQIMLQEELSKEKWKKKEVENDNERFRRSVNDAKNNEYKVEEMKRQNEQFLRAMQDLGNKGRGFEETFNDAKNNEYKVEELKRKNEQFLRAMQDLGNKGRGFEETFVNKDRNYEENSVDRSPRSTFNDIGSSAKKTVSFRNSGSKSRSKSRTKSTSPSPPRISRPHNRHIGAHLVEYGDFGERILRMENEMSQLQNKYRRLVSASKSETNGLERLKQDMGNLATELNSKSGILKKLKSEQISGRSSIRDFVTN